MIILKKIFFAIGLVIAIFIIGCSPKKDFNYGIKQLESINSKYNATMETYPKSIDKINIMINDLEELKKLEIETGKDPLNYVINYRILNLEAEKLFIEGQRYGISNIAKTGFACKPRPLIIESAALRDQSAKKGFESVDLLRKFIDSYPKEAKIAGLSQKNALFLNATFYSMYSIAKSDSGTINRFCPQNETLELYKQEFKKKANLSEDSISKLTYDEAVKIWKEIRGIN